MSRIFLSHSSENNAEALAVRDWLNSEGWDDVFLDLDPERGIRAGELWEEVLRDAAERCEAVLFLVSRAWLDSDWCRDEFRLVRHLRKHLFVILIEDIFPTELPAIMTRERQIVSIAAAVETRIFSVVLPGTRTMKKVVFGTDGLRRLKIGLQSARVEAKYFGWPPKSDPNRPPYRGLKPLEAEDAGIFFGRDAPIATTLESLRGLRDGTRPRLLVILGASGAGKSSLLRAGLFPRLARGDKNFLPLPIIRPARAALHGETGLLSALEEAFKSAQIRIARADLRVAIQGGAGTLKPLLRQLADKGMRSEADSQPTAPTLIFSIDQAEELFLVEGQNEAQALLVLLRGLLVEDAPAVIALFTIRSDNYEHLQLAKALEGIGQEVLSLTPLPKGSYAEVIKGPAQRLDGTARALKIESNLVDALLEDMEAGGAADALPLLAFTLERLYEEYHATGLLSLSNYDNLGRVKGSIEAAVQRAFKAADADARIPQDAAARLTLLRRGLIPWLAGIDPESGAPRRRAARLSEIPAEALPLIQHLVEQRLLSVDVTKDRRENTIEPAHDALLRQWGLLQGWLAEDAGLLGALEGVKRASRDWEANGKDVAWLVHGASRLEVASRLRGRPDLASILEQTDWDYLEACQLRESALSTYKKVRLSALEAHLRQMLQVRIETLEEANEQLFASERARGLGKHISVVRSEVSSNQEEIDALKNFLLPNGRWHPNEAVHVRGTGPAGDHTEIYRFSCCGRTVITENYAPNQYRADGCCPSPEDGPPNSTKG